MSAPSPDLRARLASLSRGFRARHLAYDELRAQLDAWRDAFPHLVDVAVIGHTPEGRELVVLRVGPDPDRPRPAVWVDANMHASEICGSSVALAIAEDALALHLGVAPLGEDGGHAPPLSQAARAALRDVVFHVCPRISPDGAEHVLRTGAYVRSVPRDARPTPARARWRAHDVDGDGVALLMRVRDPAGELVESADEPGLLLPRTVDDEGPFYKLYPEGTIEHYDGLHVPTPAYLADNEPDLNRNFPYGWAPEPTQVGAGRYPLSEPESRAVVEYTAARPHLFAWLNLHTFGGCFIRPLGDAPDTKMHADDRALYRQLGAWAEALTGYPMVSGFEEFTYEPEKPLHGDLVEYAYRQRGCVAYVVELWDFFAQLGKAKPRRFVEHYTSLGREDLRALWRWDREHNEGRIFRPWRPFQHPQLGAVEIGGMDGRVGISNPPYERLPEVCAKHAAHFLRVAALAPRVVVDAPVITPLPGDASRIDLTVRNLGYLPTHILGSARELPFAEPLVAEATPSGGLELLTPSEARQTIGQLDGWGRGLGEESIFAATTRGTTGARVVRVHVRGRGVLAVRVHAPRVGAVEVRVEVGP
jgi:hypothetical protein